MEFVIVTGLSGAGKSRAATILEDMGFFVVDNLPASLIPKFVEMSRGGTGDYQRVGLVCDIRSGSDFSGLFDALDGLKEMDCSYKILFLDADDEAIVKRYKETRRRHPLAEDCDDLPQCIAQEREMLIPLRQRSSFLVDTSNLSSAKMREQLHLCLPQGRRDEGGMAVSVTSFGFKHGIPVDADLVFDVRFLPNPYYLPELRPSTGLEPPVRDYVFGGGKAEEFMTYLQGLLAWLLPQYVAEGKLSLVIALGCTGGKHRSVACAHALVQFVEGQGYEVRESHRDLGKY